MFYKYQKCSKSINKTCLLYAQSLKSRSTYLFDFSPLIQPGKSNPIVQLFILKFDLNGPTRQRISVKLPIELLNVDYYLVHVQWTSQSDLILLFTLRTLNSSLIVRCTASSEFGTCTTLIQLPLERGSFTMNMKMKDFTSSFLQNANGHNQNDLYFFLRFPQKDAKHGLYNHVAGFNLKVSYGVSSKNGILLYK